MKLILGISISFNLIFLMVGIMFFLKKGGIGYLKQKKMNATNATYANAKINQFKLIDSVKNPVIMVGDSITEGGEWSELLGLNVINRGISADTSGGVLKRIDEIIDKKPSKVFIMIGINDICESLSKNEIKDNYKEILNALRNGSPSSKIYVQSILPVNHNKTYVKFDNNYIVNINDDIKELCISYNVNYIDIYSEFIKEGELKNSLTYDGVHINENGYIAWKNNIKKFID